MSIESNYRRFAYVVLTSTMQRIHWGLWRKGLNTVWIKHGKFKNVPGGWLVGNIKEKVGCRWMDGLMHDYWVAGWPAGLVNGWLIWCRGRLVRDDKRVGWLRACGSEGRISVTPKALRHVHEYFSPAADGHWSWDRTRWTRRGYSTPGLQTASSLAPRHGRSTDWTGVCATAVR